MKIYEAQLDDTLLETLIAFSRDWEAEQSCHGYRANGREDIEGRRIFLAEADGVIIGYLFGSAERTEKQSSIMPEGTTYFEVEELYVVPAQRSRGVGAALVAYAEKAVSAEAEYLLLSTATKNARAILHFYLDVVDMQFWSARLFKPLR